MKHSPIRSGYSDSPRQRQLEECLLENMRHMSYHNISISLLCDQVGVSRRTFYLYFKDKDDCLNSLIDRGFRDLLLQTETDTPDNADALEICRVFLTKFRENHVFFDLMVRNRLLNQMLYRMIHFAEYEGIFFLPVKGISPNDVDGDILSCYISSQFTLMLRWYFQNYETPVEEIARKYVRLSSVLLPDRDKI